MDSEQSIMVPKEKVISINIVRGCELSDVARATNGVSNEDLVEVRVERSSPASPKIIKLGKSQSPVHRFREALKREGFLGKRFL